MKPSERDIKRLYDLEKYSETQSFNNTKNIRTLANLW